MMFLILMKLVNCFKRAGLFDVADQAEEPGEDDVNILVASLIGDINVNIEEYNTVDDALITSDIPTDADNLESVRESHSVDEEESESKSDDKTEQQVSVTPLDVLDARKTCYSFYESNDVDDEFFCCYSRMKSIVENIELNNRKPSKQSNLHWFFVKL
ncbi:hypothetical protein QAD02_008977 [Eretmocerus hayati]|uniref:Uncharacterized protein n=1 Tax=Eretmocerus hayati TaxID=131215 RepID=A0ACC2N7Y2_9HYME|nr:hypothetical protein QAD02_008977 [Eretmocerus hayati]